MAWSSFSFVLCRFVYNSCVYSDIIIINFYDNSYVWSNCIDTEKRKKRDNPSESDTVDVSGNMIYARKESVVGIYFESSLQPLPVIGETSSGSYTVCNIQGNKTTQILNCTSDSIQADLVIFANAQIG